ncbi:hypothetical protein Tco_0051123, partial [Tanacetum coccineum]
PPSAATNFRRRKRGRLRESPPKTRLLSETAATISTIMRSETAILVVGICFCSSESEVLARVLGLDEILSWLLVYGYLEVKVVLKNIIAILRLAIGSSVGSKVGIANPESGDVGLAGGC